MMASRAAFASMRSVPGASATLYRNFLSIQGFATARFSVAGEAKAELARCGGQIKKTLPGYETPKYDENLFFSLDEDAAIVEKELNKNFVVFIRAGVASGKTTFAKYLTEPRIKSNYVLIKTPDKHQYDDWVSNIKDAHKEIDPSSESPAKLTDMLDSFASKEITLIFDEAHLTFADTTFSAALYKNKPKNLKILLFSASGEAHSADDTYRITPQPITRKLMWYPKIPDFQAVVNELALCDVHLDEASVMFLFNLCGGQFDIVVKAFQWIQETQQHDRSPEEPWDLKTTMHNVRSSMNLGWEKAHSFLEKLTESRAVKCNGKYDGDFSKTIPTEFVKVLFEGPTSSLTAGKKKELTVCGFLVPEKPKEDISNFALLNWTKSGVLFRVANPFMCKYYQDAFHDLGYFAKIKTEYLTPKTCVEMLALVVPFVSFENVVFPPVPHKDGKSGGGLSVDNFPHEQQFNAAIKAQLASSGFSTNLVVDKTEGKGEPDLVVQCMDPGRNEIKQYVVESVLARHGIANMKEHLDRFATKENYRDSEGQKCLLTIGTEGHKVVDLVKKLKATANVTNLKHVELVGLVPSPGFTNHTIYAFHGRELRSFVIPVDFVARAINKNGEVQSASQLHMNFNSSVSRYSMCTHCTNIKRVHTDAHIHTNAYTRTHLQGGG